MSAAIAYRIGVTISYAYEYPVADGRHTLRLLPATLAGTQRLIAGDLSIDPKPAERIDRGDFFGNAVTTIQLRDPHEKIRLRLTGRIERSGDGSAPEDRSPPLDQLPQLLAAEHRLDAQSPHHFCGWSPRIAHHGPIETYARDVTAMARSVLEAVRLFGTALHRDMAFDPKATTVDTDAGAAFAKRRGVCQDYSHIMIAGLRSLGIPAGYVSGLIRTIPPPGRERLEGADAMHAWIRAWCGPQLGWVEYDPTNAVHAGVDHIVIAYGRDYFDVAPVKGSLRAFGSQVSRQAVDVVPLPAEAEPAGAA